MLFELVGYLRRLVMRITGIAIASAAKMPMTEIDLADITKHRGILGNHRGNWKPGGNNRQITLLSLHHWESTCAELNAHLPWSARRANICLDTVSLGQHLLGAKLHLGEQVVLQITGETEPCKRMDEIHPGLQYALRDGWRGGATCKVITGGTIALDDKVRLEWHA